MKTKKRVLSLLAATPVISLIGMTVFMICIVLTIYLSKSNQILDILGTTGFVLFILPIFLLQFVLPSNILSLVGIDTDVPFWGQVALYALVFPFVSMFAVAAADSLFHFLPEVRLGAYTDHALRQIAMKEYMFQVWTVIGITYLSMVGGGVIFNLIFKKKMQAKTN